MSPVVMLRAIIPYTAAFDKAAWQSSMPAIKPCSRAMRLLTASAERIKSIYKKGLIYNDVSVTMYCTIRLLSLAVRTPPSHGSIRGSIPLGGNQK